MIDNFTLLVAAIELVVVDCDEEPLWVPPGIALLLIRITAGPLDDGKAGRMPEVIGTEAADGCVEWYAEACSWTESNMVLKQMIVITYRTPIPQVDIGQRRWNPQARLIPVVLAYRCRR